MLLSTYWHLPPFCLRSFSSPCISHGNGRNLLASIAAISSHDKAFPPKVTSVSFRNGPLVFCWFWFFFSTLGTAGSKRNKIHGSPVLETIKLISKLAIWVGWRRVWKAKDNNWMKGKSGEGCSWNNQKETSYLFWRCILKTFFSVQLRFFVCFLSSRLKVNHLMISAEGLSAFTFLSIQTIKMMHLIAVSLYIEVVRSVAIIYQRIVIKAKLKQRKSIKLRVLY